ncbi:MAG: metallophosphoesterase [Spirochaetaceae bacterium]|nr:metallophosphoesterase [Spirochaetaceae bacterium]
MNPLLNDLRTISSRREIPQGESYLDLVTEAADIMRHEPLKLRPLDRKGLSGGLLLFTEGIPTVIVPDLHGRREFFLAILEYPLCPGKILLDALADGTARLLCLGDAFHGEGRAQERWEQSYTEFLNGNPVSPPMMEEMAENFALMEMILRCKCAFPQYVHFLKGNHENILNEEGDGNHPFRKYAEEGIMVRDFVVRQYGQRFLKTYARLEKSFPFCAVGERFIASHAEPARFYSKIELVNTRLLPQVALGLTWTDNGAAAAGSVAEMLAEYLPSVPDAQYFGGHRPVTGAFSLRAENMFVQIHNPRSQAVAVVPADRRFDPETDIKPIESGA